ncbi:hypothetical protein SISNIDRAFT_462223 [Sistotremastrum niveocremeum HHB9708]|uniref:Uncharacterized protein n=1 Tax=Sistotremastrum niveocremeum HHB9708 TaxID=1314777 RepID=A0A164ZXC2_9AGAM|nr:hypothetical protein SISNIDRAFT_462223 [Sistotremastrum niveocremeum HHB9708]
MLRQEKRAQSDGDDGCEGARRSERRLNMRGMLDLRKTEQVQQVTHRDSSRDEHQQQQNNSKLKEPLRPVGNSESDLPKPAERSESSWLQDESPAGTRKIFDTDPLRSGISEPSGYIITLFVSRRARPVYSLVAQTE